MIPQGYVDTPEGRILLADSMDLIHEGGKMFYRTGYAIERQGVDLGTHNDYEWHESGASNSARDARLSEAVTHARLTLAQLQESGFYDDARKHSFSPRQAN